MTPATYRQAPAGRNHLFQDPPGAQLTRPRAMRLASIAAGRTYGVKALLVAYSNARGLAFGLPIWDDICRVLSGRDRSARRPAMSYPATTVALFAEATAHNQEDILTILTLPPRIFLVDRPVREAHGK